MNEHILERVNACVRMIERIIDIDDERVGLVLAKSRVGELTSSLAKREEFHE